MYPKCKKNVGTLKDSNIVKIAVKFEGTAQLIDCNKAQSLDEIIEELCRFPDWNIANSSNYGLQYQSTNKYVTEENRKLIKNGDILILTSSAVSVSTDTVKVLETGLPHEKSYCLQKLCTSSKDFIFATEFIKLRGLDILIRIINTDKYTDDTLQYVLTTFIELMEHGIVLWQTIEKLIIARIIRFTTHKSEPEIIKLALEILYNIVENSENPESIDIKFETLVRILENSTSNEAIQHNTIALINSIYRVSDEPRKSQIAYEFSSKKFRDILDSKVIQSTMGTELKYQLYIWQTMYLDLYGKRMITPLVSDELNAINKIKDLKRIAFLDFSVTVREIDTMKRRPTKTSTKIRNRLGFNSEENIEDSFTTIPPGLLPLDCLEYFAQNHMMSFKNIIAEINSTNEEYGFPLGEIAIELTKIICDLFHIGDPPSDQGDTFHQLFFSDDQPLYEFFCICIEVVNHTWRDMKATRNDFNKVLSVAKEQITRALSSPQLTLNDVNKNMRSLTYANITKIREQERASREEFESTVSAISGLKNKLTPYILKIIKKQRLDNLVQGSCFHQYKAGQRIKDKFWYARLCPNHKILHYGNCAEHSIPEVDELSSQINVADIRDFLVGKDCPIAKRKGQSILKCLFAIVYLDQSLQPCEPLEFIANDEFTQNCWVDGLSILLKKEMFSDQSMKDLDTLVSMEIKLRLLDAYGVEIDKDTPPIPPDPQDYDF